MNPLELMFGAILGVLFGNRVARQRMDSATYTAWRVKGLTRLYKLAYGAIAFVAFWWGMALLLTHVSAGVWGLVVAAVCVAWGWGVAPKRVVRREQRRVAREQQREAREADRLAQGRYRPDDPDYWR
jgi:tetrahydromethanopterin S-methyltransferase subunit E